MTLPFDRQLLFRSTSLLAGGCALGLGVNVVHPAGVSLRSFEPPTACTASEVHVEPIIEMTPHEAMHLCGRQDTVFADTRAADRFAGGHVADALHLPCSISASGAEVALKKLGNVQVVVVYGESTEEAREVAETLRRRGLNADIRVLRGGLAAWEQDGLACTSGPCRECSMTGSKEKNP